MLLEQETWFEKESAFVRRWLRPGMTVIDIGASIGVYSLPMARQVAPGGRVVAYEPASEARRLQEISRQLNGANNLEIVAAALSNAERQGHLVFGASSELNSLGNTGPGEDVRITSLDREEVVRAWQSPDFVKIDAEGEEQRIITGGRVFFDRHSPLVLFEIKAGTVINTRLRSAFIGIGYECYRALAGEPVQVRCDPHEPLDSYELNLFAAKPDRARRLAEEGFLVDPLQTWTPDANERSAAVAFLRTRPFMAPFAASIDFDGALDQNYLDGLAAYSVWHDGTRPLAQRCGALAYAFGALQTACRRAPSVARLSTFARCAWDWGRRTECVAGLQQLLQIPIALHGRRPSRSGRPAPASMRSWHLPGKAETGSSPRPSNNWSAPSPIHRYFPDIPPTWHGFARSHSLPRRWSGAELCKPSGHGGPLTCRHGCALKRPIISMPRYGARAGRCGSRPSIARR